MRIMKGIIATANMMNKYFLSWFIMVGGILKIFIQFSIES